MSDYDSSYETGGSAATLTAFFDSRSEAETAMDRLRSHGVPDASMRLTGSGTTGSSEREEKGFFEALGDFFFPSEDRYTYAEGLSRGGYLLTVSGLSADMQETAIDVLEDSGAADIEERAAAWRAEGWSGYEGAQAGASQGEAQGSSASRTAEVSGTAGFAEDRADFGQRDRDLGEDETVPVVEEKLRVGKRDASHGRVRVRSYVHDEPVSEDVELTDERVEIERRPVDRLASADDDAFRERSIEAEERREEAVVSKEARVVEEVGLRRERDTRRETVSDTVRRTEVEIDDDRAEDDLPRDPDRR